MVSSPGAALRKLGHSSTRVGLYLLGLYAHCVEQGKCPGRDSGSQRVGRATEDTQKNLHLCWPGDRGVAGGGGGARPEN